MRPFITASTIGEADAARGQHDDGVMAAAICYYVAWRMSGGEVEPVAERRRRKTAREQLAAVSGRQQADYRNSPATVGEADDLEPEHDDPSDDDPLFRLTYEEGGLFFDERNRA